MKKNRGPLKAVTLVRCLVSCFLAVIILLPVPQAAAQMWQALPAVTVGGAKNTGGWRPRGGIAGLVAYDTAYREFWAGHGSHIIVSRDNGVSWSEPKLPVPPSFYYRDIAISAGAGRILGALITPDHIFVKLEFDRTRNCWTEIDSFRLVQFHAAVDSAAIFLEGKFNSQGTAVIWELWVSHAGDQTWHSVTDLGEIRQVEQPMRLMRSPYIQEVHPTIVAVQSLDNWVEYSSETGRTARTKIPPTALYYNYSANRDVIIAGFRTLLPNPDPNKSNKEIAYFNIGVSTDGGDTWHQYDTIRFVNSDKIVTNTEYQQNHLQVSIMHLHGNTVTIVLADGTVFSTNDNGNTFWYRGVGEFIVKDDEGLLAYPARETVRTDSEGNMYYVRQSGQLLRTGQLLRVPADIRQPLELVTKGKNFYWFTLGDGTMLAAGATYLARSTDAGSTWLLTGRVTEQHKDQDYTPVPQEKMIFDRIVATDTNDVAVLSSTGNIQAQYLGEDGVYRLDGYYRLNWSYQGEVKLWIGEYHSDEYVTKNYEVASFTPDSVLDLNQGIIYMKADSIAPLPGEALPRRYESEKPQFYQQSNSEIFYQKTVLWHSTDGGGTWQEIGKGLTADSNGIPGTIASMLRLRDGRLLCGMKGYTVYTQTEFGTDNYDTSYVGGGLWVSSDNGQNWQELPHPAVTGSNVWFLKRKGDLNEQRLATAVDGGTDTLVASVGTVETKRVLDEIHEIGPDGNPRFTGFYDTISVTTMRDARIVTSTDGGVSWRVTYNEPKSRPGFSPRREIISRRDGSLLAATVESGVLWSPNGLVWTPLGNDTLNQTVILDIDVDTNDVVYAATDKGIFYINDRPTSVDDGKLNIPSKNSRFFSMWTYPAPVRTQVQVRLNNVEALSNTIRSLKLYNIYGTEVADYSTAIPQQSAGRAEFTLSLPAHIASGVYLLALDTGAGIVSSKLFVAE
ncbi:MAG: T9SS type A sorting domain-containing protein [Candidatus Kapabacteria bacterium]|nr:T9SS type A sorting domain-containing protein [Candidatus Kapabacteria bacterium]MCL4276246.1 T9SS type A sorting domain-containing protein [Ignavibacteria bacterium]